jgi:hypothetical protein
VSREDLDILPHSSDARKARRIRQLLQEIWDAPEQDGEDANAPFLTRPWWELEQLVSEELDELTRQD